MPEEYSINSIKIVAHKNYNKKKSWKRFNQKLKIILLID